MYGSIGPVSNRRVPTQEDKLKLRYRSLVSDSRLANSVLFFHQLKQIAWITQLENPPTEKLWGKNTDYRHAISLLP